jgi:predicted peroxiredoxin
MTSGPKTPWRCASPFYIAALMASNDAEVEMFFNMDGTRLLKKGVAEKILPAEPNCLSVNGKKLKTVYDFMKDAKQAGVKFYSCKQAIDSLGYKIGGVDPGAGRYCASQRVCPQGDGGG